MLSDERVRQINDFFYNVASKDDVSKNDLTTLRAMAKELEHKRETELAKLAKDFPTMAIYLDVEEEKDILNYLDAWRWEL